jgi:uncharacterized delta-60 repeat protein
LGKEVSVNKKQILFIFLCFCVFLSSLPLFSQWARTYGDTGDEQYPVAIQTSDGGYIVAGATDSFGAGGYDVWVIKLDSDGAVEWQYAYGGTGNEEANSIQQTSDGGYIVAGDTNSFGAGGWDAWIVKLDSDGAVEWQYTYGGTGSDSANSIQQTSDGGYIVAGYTYSFGAGNNDVWVLKLDSDGAVEWQYTYGGASYDNSYSIQQTSDGGYIVAGYTHSFGAGDSDFWVLKLDSTGNVDWQYMYGDANDDYAYSVQQTSDGGYIVAGETDPFNVDPHLDSDFWVLKLDSTGNVEWQYAYGIYFMWDWASSIQQTSDGGYIVAGPSVSVGGYWFHSLVLKLDSNGNIDWQKSYGGFGGDHSFWCNSIQQTSDGGYIVGCDSNTMSGGQYVGDYEWVILKLYPDGEIDPSCGVPEDSTISPSATSFSADATSVSPEDVIGVTLESTSVSPQLTSVTATTFCEAPKYDLTIFAFTGGTTDPDPGTYTYYNNTEVQIEAVPDSGYSFRGWAGGVSGTGNPITIVMDSDMSVSANFSKQGEDGDKGIFELPCFIATAAYGSPLHPYVKTLRDFRDKYLVSSKLGREFVGLYYKYSPFAADLIARHRILRIAVQINLMHLVVFGYSMVHLGPILTGGIFLFIFVFPVFFMSFLRRK